VALSKRLEAIVSLVPPSDTVADIGTDHALVPAALAERGICRRVIACDLREGPLKGAARLVSERGLSRRIRLRRGDGLEPLAAGEAEGILISGMGGALMRRILEEGEYKAKAARFLILSPQSELPMFRRFLDGAGYRILRERLVEDEGKFYFILLAEVGKGTLTDEEAEFGKNIEKEDFPDYKRYLEKELEKYRKILSGLAKTD